TPSPSRSISAAPPGPLGAVAPARRTPERWALAAWTALFLYVWFQNSWVGEDAYITGRTVWNVLHGYGLRWNVAERVQAYTHPLWMLLLVPLQLVTGDFYPAAILLSLACNLGVLAVAARIARRGPRGALLFGAFVVAMVGSRAFFDFTSSGLENPLTSLLLLAMVSLDGEADGQRAHGARAPGVRLPAQRPRHGPADAPGHGGGAGAGRQGGSRRTADVARRPGRRSSAPDSLPRLGRRRLHGRPVPFPRLHA